MPDQIESPPEPDHREEAVSAVEPELSGADQEHVAEDAERQHGGSGEVRDLKHGLDEHDRSGIR